MFDFEDWAYEKLSKGNITWQPFTWEVGDLYSDGFFHLGRPNLSPSMRNGGGRQEIRSRREVTVNPPCSSLIIRAETIAGMANVPEEVWACLRF